MPADCDRDCTNSKFEITLSESEINERLQALANEDCRHLVGYLLDHGDTTVTADSLIEHLANATDKPPEKVRTNLHHHYWPQLKNAGLVEFDSAMGELSYAGGQFTRTILGVTAAISEQSYESSGNSDN